MSDPSAEPTPAELAAWREIDVANAKAWAVQRLERARRLRDDEARQHLGNLIAAVERLSKIEQTAKEVEVENNPPRVLHGGVLVEEPRGFLATVLSDEQWWDLADAHYPVERGDPSWSFTSRQVCVADDEPFPCRHLRALAIEHGWVEPVPDVRCPRCAGRIGLMVDPPCDVNPTYIQCMDCLYQWDNWGQDGRGPRRPSS